MSRAPPERLPIRCKARRKKEGWMVERTKGREKETNKQQHEKGSATSTT